jgi:hypothetical protein
MRAALEAAARQRPRSSAPSARQRANERGRDVPREEPRYVASASIMDELRAVLSSLLSFAGEGLADPVDDAPRTQRYSERRMRCPH